MSFTNDDERDGLASLFGGITPQGVPAEEPGARRAAAEPPAAAAVPPPVQQAPVQPAAPAAAPVEPQYPGLAPQYPGLAPSAPPAEAPMPGYLAPPAFTPEPPVFGTPPAAAPAAAQPGFPPPTYTPPAYSAPVEPPVPAPAPTGAFGEPVAPVWGQPSAPPTGLQPPAQQYLPPEPYVPPAYVPPVTPDPASTAPAGAPAYDLPAPTFEPPLPTFGQHPTAYDLPAPAAPPASVEPAYGAPVAPTYPGLSPAYPGSAPAAPAYPGLAAETPAAASPPTPASPPTTQYPPTAQYPTGLEPSPYDPAPEPQPLAEPPAFSGFAALGLEPADPAPIDPGAAPISDGFAGGSLPAGDIGGAYGAPDPHRVDDVAAVEPAAPRDRSSTVLRRPAGPLLPTESPVVDDPDELARSTGFEKIGLAIAVIGGPIGLALAIVNGVRGIRRRGWLIGVGRASIILAVLSTIAAGIGGVALWNLRQEQLAHAEVAAASAEFCAAAAESPEIVEPPLLGWPEPGPTITESLTLMQDWTTRWTDLAAVSPEGLRAGLELLAANGDEVIASVEQSRLVNDAENERLIANAATNSGVASWYESYCAVP